MQYADDIRPAVRLVFMCWQLSPWFLRARTCPALVVYERACRVRARMSCTGAHFVYGGVCRCSLGASVALWSRRRGFRGMSSAGSTVLLKLSLTASFTSTAHVDAADKMRSDETRLSRGKVLLGWVESKLPCRVVSCRVKPSSFLVSASHHRLEVCQVALNGSLAHSGSQ